MGDLVSIRATLGLGTRRGTIRGTRATDWYEQGRALEATDPERAMAAYRRAIAGRRDLADAHNNLGRLHHDRGELADAEGSYRLACCIDPGVPLYWFNLGVAVEDAGRHAEAIGLYERAIEVGGRAPICADAHFNLARLLEVAARRTGDAAELRRAVRHLAAYRDLAGASRRAR